MVVYGDTISYSGEFHSINLTTEEYLQDIPMIAIQMGGADVVLGVQWLQSMGTKDFNFHEIIIIFSSKGKEIELWGIQGKPSKAIINNSIKKILKKGQHGVISQLFSLHIETSIPSTLVHL